MDLLLDLLKDKKTLIKFLLTVIQDSAKEQDGLIRLSESLTRENPNHSPENLAKCTATALKMLSKQNHAIQNLAIIALIQAQSTSFDTDVAIMMNKFGRGDEALQQMFKNKLQGD